MPDYPNDQAPEQDLLASKKEAFSAEFPPRVQDSAISKMWDLLVAGINTQWRFIQEDPRNAKSRTNPEYQELAEQYSEHLSVIAPGRPFALWTGGIAVSLYAREKRNCTTLENTVLGNAIHKMNLHETCVPWDCIGPLWNSISRMFVAKMQGQSVYLFMRTHAPLSIFYRQELTQLAALPAIPRTPADNSPNVGATMQELITRLNRLKPNGSSSLGLYFVALYAERNNPTPDEFREIDASGHLVARHNFNRERDAVAAIKRFHVFKIMESDRVYRELAGKRDIRDMKLFAANDGVWNGIDSKPEWWDELARAWQRAQAASNSVAASEMKLD